MQDDAQIQDVDDGTLLDGEQYVSFMLSDEEYGIPIMRVQEIIRYQKLTRVPQSSHYVRGVLNLRGRVMPVIDLRLKMSLSEREADRHTRIIVVESRGLSMGMVVDEVSEVISVDADRVEPAPELGTQVRTDYIHGMGKLEDRLIILLDIDKVLSDEEMAVLSESA